LKNQQNKNPYVQYRKQALTGWEVPVWLLGNPPKKRRMNDRDLHFSFLVLGAQVLVPALAARGGTDCVPCVAVHADLYIEQTGFCLGKLCHLKNTPALS
jgi:hypothetical protein